MDKSLDTFFSFLTQKIGRNAVSLVGPNHAIDPRGRLVNKSEFCIKPENTKEVSVILAEANQRGIPLIPVGGSTGLVGGQIAEKKDQVSLSLEKMNAITFSKEDSLLTVQAGAILADIKRIAFDAGRFFPLSIASEGSCQIGGNLATNAGGVNVLRYGSVRDLCLGIEAVLPNGNIVSSMKALKKNNMGFDIKGLLIGSEGTLAVITSAILRTFPLPIDPLTTIISVNEPREALIIFNHMSKIFGDRLMAFELMKSTGIDFLRKTGFKVKYPFSEEAPWMVLVDIDMTIGSTNFRDQVQEILRKFLEKNLANEIVIPVSLKQKKEVWSIRESIPLANRKIGSLFSNDISLPLESIPEFIEEADKRLSSISNEIVVNCFGHIGDGNLHYNVFPIAKEATKRLEKNRSVMVKMVNDLVNELSGSISAEHGIGRSKSKELERYEDPGKLSIMTTIKTAIDPKGILNPGVIFSKETL
ncbi:MAG: hydroxyacid dehydrogenase [Rhodobacteraceae bacterium]|nr:MAG: hydroxyacid dehydrogenase [Paracoccaceae bacterium]